ncbi:MAG: hypothetical protein U0805_13610 [Pirellulales bacterium]
MNDVADNELGPRYVEHLPLWWRCVLIAAAMIILNACAEPLTRTHLTPDASLVPQAEQPGAAMMPGLPGARMQMGPVMEQVVPSSPMIQTTPEDVGAVVSEDGSVLAGDAGAVVAGEPAVISDDDEATICDGDTSNGEPSLATASHKRPGPSLRGSGMCAADGGEAVDPYGPVLGPGDEYLCDGGDYVTPAGVHADWSITGLEQEDAISHYDTVDGRTLVTPSNRVCIYAPRFAVVRRVVQPIAHEQPVFINQTKDDLALAKATMALPPVSQKQRHAVLVDMGQQPPNLFRGRMQAGGMENLQATMDAFSALQPQVNLTIVRTGEVSQAEKALVERAKENAIALTGVQAPQVLFGVKQAHVDVGVRQPGLVYQTNGPEHPQLRLLKLASCGHAAPGEEVEFTLRYDNIGDQVIGNVTIVDNLSTRFEYVAESAKSSVDADFITQSNDAGSLILRWEIRDPVKPGEGGVLRFRVKVR